MGRRHKEGSVLIAAAPEIVFAYVDDHSRLSSHMSESSWMMGGGGMGVELDAAKGQAVGSHIRLSGNVFGIRLFLDEVVTRRNPPREKVWETVGPPRLLVIGSYSMVWSSNGRTVTLGCACSSTTTFPQVGQHGG